MDKIYIKARDGKPILKGGLNDFVQMVLNISPNEDAINRRRVVEITPSDIFDELYKTRIDEILLLDIANARHIVLSIKSMFPSIELEEAKKV